MNLGIPCRCSVSAGKSTHFTSRGNGTSWDEHLASYRATKLMDGFKSRKKKSWLWCLRRPNLLRSRFEYCHKPNRSLMTIKLTKCMVTSLSLRQYLFCLFVMNVTFDDNMVIFVMVANYWSRIELWSFNSTQAIDASTQLHKAAEICLTSVL